MIIAVILSILIMMVFSGPVGNFVNQHPSLQMLGLSFLILIGFMLIAEGGHQAEFEVLGNKIGTIPKGYLYFSICFLCSWSFWMSGFAKEENRFNFHGPSQKAISEGLMEKMKSP